MRVRRIPSGRIDALPFAKPGTRRAALDCARECLAQQSRLDVHDLGGEVARLAPTAGVEHDAARPYLCIQVLLQRLGRWRRAKAHHQLWLELNPRAQERVVCLDHLRSVVWTAPEAG